jgi:hypothetical protein
MAAFAIVQCIGMLVSAAGQADRGAGPQEMTSFCPSKALANSAGALALVCALSSGGCSQPQPEPSIYFTHLPPAGQGTPAILNTIEGRVTGARPGQRIVLFARSGVWWVQPLKDKSFTTIQPDSKWKNLTHPGNAYAALLVDPGYVPPATVNQLPPTGGLVRAVATAEGPTLSRPVAKTLYFSGYEWEIRQTPGNPGGSPNVFDPANAWTDSHDHLHLRIARGAKGWTSGEVTLSRSLGYGSYQFVVNDISGLDPAAVLTISTWDGAGPYREMDIEISRWGQPGGKNAQYVVQPYYIPANVIRFLAPAGPLVNSMMWEPGRVSFVTSRPRAPDGKPAIVAAHVFSSGIPPPGNEAVRMSLYVFDSKQNPLQHEAEVTIEKFEYLP